MSVKVNLGLAALCLVIAGSVSAGTVLGTFETSGGDLGAKAQFSTSGGNLFLTLTNTATVATNARAKVLTAVFVKGELSSFTPVSAYVGSGSAAKTYANNTWSNFNWGSNTVGNVGGEWAHAKNFSGLGETWNYGISSSGFDIFGAATFGGNNLAGPAAVNGQQFGIVSSATFGTAPQGGLGSGSNAFPLVGNSVIFNLGAATTLGNIQKVQFVYGTSLGENSLTATPSPLVTVVPLPTAVLSGMALLAVVPAMSLVRRRRLGL